VVKSKSEKSKKSNKTKTSRAKTDRVIQEAVRTAAAEPTTTSVMVLASARPTGALATMDVVYGPGAGAEPRLEPSAVFRTSADFRFTDPPSSISSSTSVTHRSYLDNLIDESEVRLEDAAAWLGAQSTAVAERVLRAELTVNPGNVGVLTSLVSLGVVESEAQETMWEQAIAAAPDDVDVHRAYQDSHPHDEELVSTYRERVARAPDAANLYLLARVIDDDAESRVLCGRAVVTDPEAPWCYRALAWLDAKAGLFTAAEANLERFATLRPDDADEVVEERLRLARLLGCGAPRLNPQK
jgi:Tfp pilus assembly protein PilF